MAFNIFANNNEMKQKSKHEDYGCACSSCVSEQQRRDAFDKGAAMYDEDIGTDELVMGLPLIRRIFIGWNSTGRVLEVAAGTGRNLKYYDFNKVSLTSLDCSEEMNALSEAKAKALKVPRTVQSFAMDSEELKFEDDTFDTAIRLASVRSSTSIRCCVKCSVFVSPVANSPCRAWEKPLRLAQ